QRGAARAQAPEVLELARLERFLDPGQAVLLERARQPRCKREVPRERVHAPVPHQHRLRSEALAQEPDELDVALHVAAEPRVALLAEPELAALEAELADVAGMPVSLDLEASVRGVRARNRPEPLVVRAAQQLHDRHAQQPALEIPE